MKIVKICTVTALMVFASVGVYLGLSEQLVTQFWLGVGCLFLAIANIFDGSEGK